MSDETTLLPCPFCGGEAECHRWWSATISGKYATVCTKCNCGTDYYATEAEAIAAWNTRATHGTLTAEQVEKIVDRNCEWYEGGEIDAQAIADELNAKLGSGTCEIESEFWHDHGGYDSDTYEFVLSCGHSVEWLDGEPPSFCPSCGKKVLQCDR